MLSSRISWFAALSLAALSLTAATCNKGPPAEEPPKPAAPAPDPGAGGSGQVAQAAPSGPSDADRARLTLSGIPGMDFSSLAPSAQRELANVFSDEFCYCGCPHTLGACLKTHPSCRHAKRMALLAAPEAQAGVPSTEIIVELGKYYRSFREGRSTAVKVDERMCKGASAKDAKVTLVEYSDFECPYCGHAAPMLAQLSKDLAGKGLRVCYAPFPLSGHPNGLPAAQAALYARDHGKFWELHDLLFQNQAGLSPQVIKQLSAQVGLSAAEVGKVLDEKKYVDELNVWRESGRSAGVDSTPSMYFNGRKFGLPMNPETLKHTVDDELEWIANKNAWAAD